MDKIDTMFLIETINWVYMAVELCLRIHLISSLHLLIVKVSTTLRQWGRWTPLIGKKPLDRQRAEAVMIYNLVADIVMNRNKKPVISLEETQHNKVRLDQLVKYIPI